MEEENLNEIKMNEVDVVKSPSEINKEKTIAELIEDNPEMVEKLSQMGLGCAGCSFSHMETIEQGAMGHGMDPEEVLKELNRSGKEDGN